MLTALLIVIATLLCAGAVALSVDALSRPQVRDRIVNTWPILMSLVLYGEILRYTARYSVTGVHRVYA